MCIRDRYVSYCGHVRSKNLSRVRSTYYTRVKVKWRAHTWTRVYKIRASHVITRNNAELTLWRYSPLFSHFHFGLTIVAVFAKWSKAIVELIPHSHSYQGFHHLIVFLLEMVVQPFGRTFDCSRCIGLQHEGSEVVARSRGIVIILYLMVFIWDCFAFLMLEHCTIVIRRTPIVHVDPIVRIIPAPSITDLYRYRSLGLVSALILHICRIGNRNRRVSVTMKRPTYP